ncbi:MAG: ferritin family protein [Thermoplasmata archaeon]|nr:ferritin family protein [Thermoplasmata archaeon]
MATTKSTDKSNLNAISIALKKEEDSFIFYKNAEKTVQFKPLKTLFRDLAKQEVKHKSILIKEAKKLEGGAKKVDKLTKGPGKTKDYGLSKYLLPQNVKPTMGYQEALIVAMKREEKAVELFDYLKSITTDKNLKNTFNTLYKWEIEHLRILEEKYDEDILTEN